MKAQPGSPSFPSSHCKEISDGVMTKKKAPICNPTNHPKIVKVTPDTVKPGDKVMIKGNHFGTKECFHNVSFGSSSTTFKYVNETTLEATVPSLKAGITPINVLTEGGSSQSVVLVNAK